MKPLKKQICQNGQTEGTEIFLYRLYGTIAFVFANRFRLDRYSRAMGDSMLDDNMETANVYQKALKIIQQYMDKLEKEAQENLRTEKQKQIFRTAKKRLEKNV